MHGNDHLELLKLLKIDLHKKIPKNLLKVNKKMEKEYQQLYDELLRS